MSFLRGEPRSRWPLERAIEALGAAARRAGTPGSWWIAGLGYGFLAFSWTFGTVVAAPILERVLPGESGVLEWLRSTAAGRDPSSLLLRSSGSNLVLGIVALLAASRMAVGLARAMPRERWDELRGERRAPQLGQIWAVGHGLTRQTAGLWFQVLLMMGLATVLFLLPARVLALLGDGHWDLATGLMGGTALTLAVLYGFLLSVIFQLALHSLARNQRGVGSALLHAWRLARNDAGATARAVMVDASLYAVTVVLQVLVLVLVSLFSEGLAFFAMLALEAWLGSTRCGLWSRAYVGLGGVETTARGASPPSGPASAAALAAAASAASASPPTPPGPGATDPGEPRP